MDSKDTADRMMINPELAGGFVWAIVGWPRISGHESSGKTGAHEENIVHGVRKFEFARPF